MIEGKMTAALFGAATLALLGAAAPASAATCAAGCTEAHTQCTRSGKDYGACMDAWRQCKTSCLMPAKTSQAPPPKATPAVAHR